MSLELELVLLSEGFIRADSFRKLSSNGRLVGDNCCFSSFCASSSRSCSIYSGRSQRSYIANTKLCECYDRYPNALKVLLSAYLPLLIGERSQTIVPKLLG